jgi:hypothetical protein
LEKDKKSLAKLWGGKKITKPTLVVGMKSDGKYQLKGKNFRYVFTELSGQYRHRH